MIRRRLPSGPGSGSRPSGRLRCGSPIRLSPSRPSRPRRVEVVDPPAPRPARDRRTHGPRRRCVDVYLGAALARTRPRPDSRGAASSPDIAIERVVATKASVRTPRKRGTDHSSPLMAVRATRRAGPGRPRGSAPPLGVSSHRLPLPPMRLLFHHADGGRRLGRVRRTRGRGRRGDVAVSRHRSDAGLVRRPVAWRHRTAIGLGTSPSPTLSATHDGSPPAPQRRPGASPAASPPSRRRRLGRRPTPAERRAAALPVASAALDRVRRARDRCLLGDDLFPDGRRERCERWPMSPRSPVTPRRRSPSRA